MTVTLHTARLTLRQPDPSDLDVFLAYSDSDRFRRERGEKPLPDRWSYFATLLGHWQICGFGRFLVTVKDTGIIIGHIGPLFPAGWPEREIAWHLWSDEAEGKGFAFEAARAAVRHAFDDLGWDTAASFILPQNTRSRRLAERLGAVVDPEAKGMTFDGVTTLVYRHPRQEVAA
jgi:RimJ/RimL family protein N-acetyltransferase